MELTKEYFDKALKNLVTKDDLDKRLENQTQTLIAFAEDQTEALARLIKGTVDEPMHQRFDALETKLDNALRRVDTVETKVQRIEEALHITF